MTGFDDFDDDETIVHQSARGGVDEFDDDDTFLAAQITRLDPMPQATGSNEATQAMQPRPPDVPDASRRDRSNPALAPSGRSPASAPPGPDAVRSLGALREQAPLGPGWQPPDRPTSYQPAPYDGSARSRFSRARLAALILVLGVAGGGLAVGAWLLMAGSGGVGP